ncbi:MAG: hypothetical protein MJE66_11245 [Proteobacteria bacterium]|nr:hypothetical protein [Pseudomonadota bacterium]
MEEALARARRHTRAAVAEGLLAARALLDATSLTLSGRPAEDERALGLIARGMEDLAARLSNADEGVPSAVVDAILDALDAEIARWEQRATNDSDARAVLRAFLGVREILWEFGLRRSGKAAPRSRPTPTGEPRRDPEPVRPARVRRVEVQG